MASTEDKEQSPPQQTDGPVDEETAKAGHGPRKESLMRNDEELLAWLNTKLTRVASGGGSSNGVSGSRGGKNPITQLSEVTQDQRLSRLLDDVSHRVESIGVSDGCACSGQSQSGCAKCLQTQGKASTSPVGRSRAGDVSPRRNSSNTTTSGSSSKIRGLSFRELLDGKRLHAASMLGSDRDRGAAHLMKRLEALHAKQQLKLSLDGELDAEENSSDIAVATGVSDSNSMAEVLGGGKGENLRTLLLYLWACDEQVDSRRASRGHPNPLYSGKKQEQAQKAKKEDSFFSPLEGDTAQWSAALGRFFSNLNKTASPMSASRQSPEQQEQRHSSMPLPTCSDGERSGGEPSAVGGRAEHARGSVDGHEMADMAALPRRSPPHTPASRQGGDEGQRREAHLHRVAAQAREEIKAKKALEESRKNKSAAVRKPAKQPSSGAVRGERAAARGGGAEQTPDSHQHRQQGQRQHQQGPFGPLSDSRHNRGTAGRNSKGGASVLKSVSGFWSVQGDGEIGEGTPSRSYTPPPRLGDGESSPKVRDLSAMWERKAWASSRAATPSPPRRSPTRSLRSSDGFGPIISKLADDVSRDGASEEPAWRRGGQWGQSPTEEGVGPAAGTHGDVDSSPGRPGRLLSGNSSTFFAENGRGSGTTSTVPPPADFPGEGRARQVSQDGLDNTSRGGRRVPPNLRLELPEDGQGGRGEVAQTTEPCATPTGSVAGEETCSPVATKSTLNSPASSSAMKKMETASTLFSRRLLRAFSVEDETAAVPAKRAAAAAAAVAAAPKATPARASKPPLSPPLTAPSREHKSAAPNGQDERSVAATAIPVVDGAGWQESKANTEPERRWSVSVAPLAGGERGGEGEKQTGRAGVEGKRLDTLPSPPLATAPLKEQKPNHQDPHSTAAWATPLHVKGGQESKVNAEPGRGPSVADVCSAGGLRGGEGGEEQVGKDECEREGKRLEILSSPALTTPSTEQDQHSVAATAKPAEVVGGQESKAKAEPRRRPSVSDALSRVGGRGGEGAEQAEKGKSGETAAAARAARVDVKGGLESEVNAEPGRRSSVTGTSLGREGEKQAEKREGEAKQLDILPSPPRRSPTTGQKPRTPNRKDPHSVAATAQPVVDVAGGKESKAEAKRRPSGADVSSAGGGRGGKGEEQAGKGKDGEAAIAATAKPVVNVSGGQESKAKAEPKRRQSVSDVPWTETEGGEGEDQAGTVEGEGKRGHILSSPEFTVRPTEKDQQSEAATAKPVEEVPGGQESKANGEHERRPRVSDVPSAGGGGGGEGGGQAGEEHAKRGKQLDIDTNNVPRERGRARSSAGEEGSTTVPSGNMLRGLLSGLPGFSPEVERDPLRSSWPLPLTPPGGSSLPSLSGMAALLSHPAKESIKVPADKAGPARATLRVSASSPPPTAAAEVTTPAPVNKSSNAPLDGRRSQSGSVMELVASSISGTTSSSSSSSSKDRQCTSSRPSSPRSKGPPRTSTSALAAAREKGAAGIITTTTTTTSSSSRSSSKGGRYMSSPPSSPPPKGPPRTNTAALAAARERGAAAAAASAAAARAKGRGREGNGASDSGGVVRPHMERSSSELQFQTELHQQQKKQQQKACSPPNSAQGASPRATEMGSQRSEQERDSKREGGGWEEPTSEPARLASPPPQARSGGQSGEERVQQVQGEGPSPGMGRRKESFFDRMKSLITNDEESSEGGAGGAGTEGKEAVVVRGRRATTNTQTEQRSSSSNLWDKIVGGSEGFWGGSGAATNGHNSGDGGTPSAEGREDAKDAIQHKGGGLGMVFSRGRTEQRGQQRPEGVPPRGSAPLEKASGLFPRRGRSVSSTPVSVWSRRSDSVTEDTDTGGGAIVLAELRSPAVQERVDMEDMERVKVAEEATKQQQKREAEEKRKRQAQDRKDGERMFLQLQGLRKQKERREADWRLQELRRIAQEEQARAADVTCQVDLCGLAAAAPRVIRQAVLLLGSMQALAACESVCKGWQMALHGHRKGLVLSAVTGASLTMHQRSALWRRLVLSAPDSNKLLMMNQSFRLGSGSVGGVGEQGRPESPSGRGKTKYALKEALKHGTVPLEAFPLLVEAGEEGPYSAMIGRDVPRAFGQIAPHRQVKRRTASSRSPTNRTRSMRGEMDDLERTDTSWALIPVGLKRGCLSNVLHAASAVHADVGYCQGMDRIVEMLMQILGVEGVEGMDQDNSDARAQREAGVGGGGLEAGVAVAALEGAEERPEGAAVGPHGGVICAGHGVFQVYSGLFRSYRLRELYLPERGGMLVMAGVVEMLVKSRMPVLAQHFEKEDFALDMVLMGWFQTLMLHLHALPASSLMRIWDVWLVTGDPQIFVQVAVAIVHLSKPVLLRSNFDAILAYFNTFPDNSVLYPEQLLTTALGITFPEGELMYMELRVRSEQGYAVANAAELLLRPGDVFGEKGERSRSGGL